MLPTSKGPLSTEEADQSIDEILGLQVLEKLACQNDSPVSSPVLQSSVFFPLNSPVIRPVLQSSVFFPLLCCHPVPWLFVAGRTPHE